MYLFVYLFEWSPLADVLQLPDGIDTRMLRHLSEPMRCEVTLMPYAGSKAGGINRSKYCAAYCFIFATF